LIAVGYELIHQTPYHPAEREALMNRIAPPLAALSLVVMPSLALAHPGHEGPSDLVHGFMHPLGGADHILAMVAVGLFAVRLGGRALWLVPGSFLLAMAVAGLAGMAGVMLPHVETGIALSVLLLGAAIALGLTMPVAVAMGLVAFFAVFHGLAHGAEMPQSASGLAYGLGFLGATALLHGAGIGLGRVIARAPVLGRRAAQFGGAATAVAGAMLLAGTM
jgi:urease accessory protein